MDDALLKLAITRSEALYNFRTALRQQGVPALEACELMAEHAKYLDANGADLETIRQCIGRKS